MIRLAQTFDKNTKIKKNNIYFLYKIMLQL